MRWARRAAALPGRCRPSGSAGTAWCKTIGRRSKGGTLCAGMAHGRAAIHPWPARATRTATHPRAGDSRIRAVPSSHSGKWHEAAAVPRHTPSRPSCVRGATRRAAGLGAAGPCGAASVRPPRARTYGRPDDPRGARTDAKHHHRSLIAHLKVAARARPTRTPTYPAACRRTGAANIARTSQPCLEPRRRATASIQVCRCSKARFARVARTTSLTAARVREVLWPSHIPLETPGPTGATVALPRRPS